MGGALAATLSCLHKQSRLKRIAAQPLPHAQSNRRLLERRAPPPFPLQPGPIQNQHVAGQQGELHQALLAEADETGGAALDWPG